MFDYLGFYNIKAAAALAVAMFLGMTIGGQEKLIMKHGIKRILIISLNWQILSLTFLLFPNVYT
jgi:TM2 domain-containing membrane protein YozV